jgi:cytochrome c5|tara:strand:- start:30801 stop:31262 length:462 start_codon:yes stop_codon:yes gene_type:complete
LEDKQFTTYFLSVLGALAVFTISILILANSLTSEPDEMDRGMASAVAERTKPMANVYVGSVPVAATQAPAAMKVAVELSGEEVYQQVCAACHNAGVMNAPKPGDKAAWDQRLAKGIDVVYANAIGGIGGMPAKGGRADLSDAAVKAAVDYLTK